MMSKEFISFFKVILNQKKYMLLLFFLIPFSMLAQSFHLEYFFIGINALYAINILKKEGVLILSFMPDRNYTYRSRELFLLPVSRLELIFLVIFNEIMFLIFAAYLFFSTRLLLGHKLDAFMYFLTAYLLFLKITMAFEYNNYSKSLLLSIISMVRWGLLSVLVACVFFLAMYFGKKKMGIPFESSVAITAIFILLGICLSFFHSAKKAYFNEHLAYRRRLFSPWFDCTSLVALSICIYLVLQK